MVQAGGGNSSVKLENGLMLIKASGFMLSEVDFDNGYSKVDNKAILESFEDNDIASSSDVRIRDSLSAGILKEAVVDSSNKPSMETFLHSLFYKYTLHTHPLILNAITCKKNWKDILSKILGGNIAFVDYRTPGFELACKLKGVIERYSEKPKIVLLQNHGLITSSNDYEELVTTTEEVLNKLEDYLGIDLKDYKYTNKISFLVNSIKNTSFISYLSFDSELNRMIKTNKALFFSKPFCPDGMVYCGAMPLEITSIEDKEPFIEYQKVFFELPRVVIYLDKIFFIAQNLKKARDIEDVFKFHMTVLSIAGDNINFLTDDELQYLNSWEAEKYRRRLRR